jgi:hypothetical protein
MIFKIKAFIVVLSEVVIGTWKQVFAHFLAIIEKEEI